MCDPTSIANLDPERGLRESSLKARMRLVQSAWDDAEREIRASMLELNARVDRLPGIADLVKAVVIMHLSTWAGIGAIIAALVGLGIIGR